MSRYKGKSKKQIKKVDEDNLNESPDTILKDRCIQFVLILTVIGGFLRFYHLDFNSLWLDEASTLTMSKPALDVIWNYGLSGDFHPPLFHVIEHYMLVFGQSEFVLRFIPAILGTLTIPIFYFIGIEFRDKSVGVICAALLTVSCFGIFYSQEAYSYSVVLFVFSLVILFYLRALRTDALKDWIMFGGLSALAFWTHYYVFVPLGIMYLYTFYSHREKLTESISNAKHIVISFAIMTALAIPLLFFVLERFKTLTASAPTYGVLGLAMVPETILRLSGGYSPQNWMMAILYVGLAIVGLVMLYKENPGKSLFSVMILTLSLMFSIIISAKMTMNPRYLIYLLPIYFALIAMSYPFISGLIRDKRLLYAVVAVVIAINTPFLLQYYSGFTKEDWRGFSQVVQGVTKPGDIVVILPGYISQPFVYYYNNATDQTMRYNADNGKDLERINLNKGASNIFYVVTGDISASNPQGDAVAWLEQNTQPVTLHTGVYLLTNKPSG